MKRWTQWGFVNDEQLAGIEARRARLAPIEWKPLDQANIHGVCATVGARYCEVVRAYEGQWFAYRKLSGKVCKLGSNEPHYETRKAAIARGERFLKGEDCPEVWL